MFTAPTAITDRAAVRAASAVELTPLRLLRATSPASLGTALDRGPCACNGVQRGMSMSGAHALVGIGCAPYLAQLARRRVMLGAMETDRTQPGPSGPTPDDRRAAQPVGGHRRRHLRRARCAGRPRPRCEDVPIPLDLPKGLGNETAFRWPADPLARGGMAQVFAGEDKRLGAHRDPQSAARRRRPAGRHDRDVPAARDRRGARAREAPAPGDRQDLRARQVDGGLAVLRARESRRRVAARPARRARRSRRRRQAAHARAARAAVEPRRHRRGARVRARASRRASRRHAEQHLARQARRGDADRLGHRARSRRAGRLDDRAGSTNAATRAAGWSRSAPARRRTCRSSRARAAAPIRASTSTASASRSTRTVSGKTPFQWRAGEVGRAAAPRRSTRSSRGSRRTIRCSRRCRAIPSSAESSRAR